MTFVRRFISVVGGVTFCLLAVTGCTPDPNHEFIEGQWIFDDPHLQDVIGQSFLEHVWVFHEGNFSYEVCCLHEIYMRGYYDIVESGDGYVIMDLYNIEANEAIYETEQQIRITLDHVADTIIISHSGPYTRAFP
ncbi:MAG: hypothetical protein Fur0022_31050 [Anaerolineales bacterium]